MYRRRVPSPPVLRRRVITPCCVRSASRARSRPLPSRSSDQERSQPPGTTVRGLPSPRIVRPGASFARPRSLRRHPSPATRRSSCWSRGSGRTRRMAHSTSSSKRSARIRATRSTASAVIRPIPTTRMGRSAPTLSGSPRRSARSGRPTRASTSSLTRWVVRSRTPRSPTDCRRATRSSRTSRSPRHTMARPEPRRARPGFRSRAYSARGPRCARSARASRKTSARARSPIWRSSAPDRHHQESCVSIFAW